MLIRLVAMASVAATVAAPVFGNEYEPALRALAEEQLSAWVADPQVTDAILAQNAKHAGISDSQVNELDQTWRAGVDAGGAPMIDEVLGTPTSQMLLGLAEESEGLVTEVFVMDAFGLNVAQSGVTSDYWQGDEAKWQETFGVGAGAMHFSEVEFDESTQTYQTQVSMAISDPASGDVIGAVTFGIDVGYLE